MVLDFRIRPPYKSYLDLHIFRSSPPPADPRKQAALTMNRGPMPSREEGSMEHFLAEMDAAGITRAVVMGRSSPTFYGRVDNGHIQELINAHPQRFMGFAGIDLADMEQAVVATEHWLQQPGFKGIAIDPQWEDPPFYPGDERLDPVYAKCRDMGGICSITSSIFLGPDMTYSEPVHIQRVALRFPQLPIVVPHACWPHIEGALGMAMQCANVYLLPDFYGYIPQMPMADQIVRATNYYLRHRILYGSSYPVRPLGQSLEEFKRLELDQEAQANCLWHNGAHLLGLE